MVRAIYTWMAVAVVMLLCGGGLGTGRVARAALPAAGLPLINPGNGPVMHRPVIHLIFWLPKGAHFQPKGTDTTDAHFEDLMTQFMEDLSGSNHYAIASQYHDKKGTVARTLKVGAAGRDTEPYPINRGSKANPLQDQDIRREIVDVSKAEKWNNVQGEAAFFVFTGYGVQSCDAGDPAHKLKPSCTFHESGGYCGYHDSFNVGKTNYIYSYMPVLTSGCDADEEPIANNPPNKSAVADITLNTLSHEIFETVTDPQRDAWGDKNGKEIADKCDTVYGKRARDGSNIVLNRHLYILQWEWSNKDGGCALTLGNR